MDVLLIESLVHGVPYLWPEDSESRVVSRACTRSPTRSRGSRLAAKGVASIGAVGVVLSACRVLRVETEADVGRLTVLAAR